MQKKMFNYCVIIPYKNLPNLLEIAVKSIPIRDDIQIVVIDDNSDLELKEDNYEFLKRDTLSYVYTTEGKGAGFARNIGIDNSNAKWLLFLDADDYFHEQAFEIFDKYRDSDYDVIHFNQQGVDLDTGEPSSRCDMFQNLILQYSSNPSLMNSNIIRYKLHTPYVKMIRANMVKHNHIRFDECLASNDVMFSARVGYHASKIFVDPNVCYYVTERRGSLTKVRSKENAFSRYCVWLSYNDYMLSVGAKECREMVLSWIIKSLVYFGSEEFCKYIKKAYETKSNIFVKSYGIISSIYHHIVALILKDKYIVKE